MILCRVLGSAVAVPQGRASSRAAKLLVRSRPTPDGAGAGRAACRGRHHRCRRRRPRAGHHRLGGAAHHGDTARSRSTRWSSRSSTRSSRTARGVYERRGGVNLARVGGPRRRDAPRRGARQRAGSCCCSRSTSRCADQGVAARRGRPASCRRGRDSSGSCNGVDAVDALPRASRSTRSSSASPTTSAGRRADPGRVVGERRGHRPPPRLRRALAARAAPAPARRRARRRPSSRSTLVGAGVGDDVLVSRPPGLARELLGGRRRCARWSLGILDAPPEAPA